MKTMTCKQFGGPCDFAIQANSGDEAIKAQDAHLKESVANGDDVHKDALSAMQGRWKNPIKAMGWYIDTKKMFNALPEERS